MILTELNARQRKNSRYSESVGEVSSQTLPKTKQAKLPSYQQNKEKKQVNYYRDFFKALFRLMRKSSVKKDELGMWGLETRAWIVAIGIYLGRITGILG